MGKKVQEFHQELYFSNIVVPAVNMSEDNAVPEITTEKVVSTLKDRKQGKPQGQDGILLDSLIDVYCPISIFLALSFYMERKLATDFRKKTYLLLPKN